MVFLWDRSNRPRCSFHPLVLSSGMKANMVSIWNHKAVHKHISPPLPFTKIFQWARVVRNISIHPAFGCLLGLSFDAVTGFALSPPWPPSLSAIRNSKWICRPIESKKGRPRKPKEILFADEIDLRGPQKCGPKGNTNGVCPRISSSRDSRRSRPVIF